MYQSQYIKQVQDYRDDELHREVSVYRYIVKRPYDPTDIDQKISANYLRKTSFGIMNQLPTKDGSTRTLWAKLGKRNFAVVDEDGLVTYLQVDRVITSSAVVEFFEDTNHLGLIIFGGSANIHSELLTTLERNFGFRNIISGSLKPEQLRNMVSSHWRKIKKICIDPSEDTAWGGVGNAQLMSSRGRYIDVDASILKNIRQNKQILISGFKSVIEKVSVSGMKKEVRASFELTQNCVRIRISDFALWEAAERGKTEEVFYDLMRNVYFQIVGDERWVDNRPPIPRLPLFASEFDTDDD